MKKLPLSLLFITGILVSAFGQYGPTNDSLYVGFDRDTLDAIKKPKLMIVPFYPKRYISEVDRYVGEAYGYTYQQTRGFWRKGLDNALIIAAKDYNDPISMHKDDPDVNKDLDFIYKTMQYGSTVYEAPEMTTEEQSLKDKAKQKLRSLKALADNDPEGGARIEQGELVHVVETREWITSAKVYNPLVIDSMGKKYGAEYYLMINELNIMNMANDYRQLELEDYPRLIKVHYTVLDINGNELYTQIAKRTFSSKENDLREIIRTHFLALGEDIVTQFDYARFIGMGLQPVVAR